MKLKYLLVFAIFWACNEQTQNNKDQSLQQIIKADTDASKLATEIGFNNALLSVADSSFVKLGNGQLPIVGKTAFANSFDKDNDIKTITWQPINGEVAKSYSHFTIFAFDLSEKRKAKSEKRKAKSEKRRAKSQEPRAKSQKKLTTTTTTDNRQPTTDN